jgi:hypothetical protein
VTPLNILGGTCAFGGIVLNRQGESREAQRRQFLALRPFFKSINGLGTKKSVSLLCIRRQAAGCTNARVGGRFPAKIFAISGYGAEPAASSLFRTAAICGASAPRGR